MILNKKVYRGGTLLSLPRPLRRTQPIMAKEELTQKYKAKPVDETHGHKTLPTPP
jgi:hypothetical protein